MHVPGESARIASRNVHQRTASPLAALSARSLPTSGAGEAVQLSTNDSDTSPPDASELVGQLGAGQPLESGIADTASRSLQHDLSGVRVHPDNPSAKRIGADAFTIGHHVAFAPGNYRPGTHSGDHLIAHELTHVVQQRGNSGRQQASGLTSDRYEAEAEQAADAILAGQTVTGVSSLDGARIQRWPPEQDVCIDTEYEFLQPEPVCEAEGETPAFDPASIDPAALTHGELNRYTGETNAWLDSHDPSDPSYSDYSDLCERLSEQRRTRVDTGELWLSEVTEGSPGTLVRMQGGEDGRNDVFLIDPEFVNGELPTSSSTRTMTEDQFQAFLGESQTPTIDYDTYIQIRLLESLMSGGLASGPGEGGSEGIGATPLFGAQPAIAGVGAAGLYNSPLDVSLMSTFARPTSGRGSGGPYRAFGRYAEAGIPAQSRHAYGLGMLDLNTLPYTNSRGRLIPATSETYPTFDFQRTRGPAARILGVTRISVKTSQRPLQTNRFRYYLSGLDAMMQGGGGRSTLPTYIANQPELTGMPYGQARSTVLSGAVIAVNSDDVAGLRALLADPTQAALSPNTPAGQTLWNDTGHRGGPQSTTSIRALFAAEMRESPVRVDNASGTHSFDTPDALDQARANNTITQAEYQAAQREVGRRVSRRVVSSGVSTTEVGALRSSRQGNPLTQAQNELLMTPEYIGSERRGGGLRGQARAAGASSIRGGGAGTLLAVVTTAGIMLIDEEEHPNWEQELAVSGGLGLLGGSSGAAAEQVLISSGTRYAISRTASGAPTWLTGTRITALGRFGGGGIGAGFTELAMMGLFEEREHSGAEVAVRTGRAFVLGGTSTYVGVAAGTAAGTILTSALAGTAAGTAVPGLGNAIGFVIGLGVGIGLYLAADRIVPGGRADWENPRPRRTSSGGGSTWRPSLYGCFAAGTSVLMANGAEKPIETIQIGDKIASFNELTQSASQGVVMKTHRHPPARIVRLKLANGRILRVTREHRLFVEGRWIRVEALEPGRQCLCAMDEGLCLSAVPIVSIEPEEKTEEVYNLSVLDHHTYFAEGTVVHNAK